MMNSSTPLIVTAHLFVMPHCHHSTLFAIHNHNIHVCDPLHDFGGNIFLVLFRHFHLTAPVSRNQFL